MAYQRPSTLVVLAFCWSPRALVRRRCVRLTRHLVLTRTGCPGFGGAEHLLGFPTSCPDHLVSYSRVLRWRESLPNRAAASVRYASTLGYHVRDQGNVQHEKRIEKRIAIRIRDHIKLG